jgi:hypothetical protein
LTPRKNPHELAELQRRLQTQQLIPDSDVGYFFDVDLEIPRELHDLTDDFPLCPEQQKITEEMISPAFKRMIEVEDPTIKERKPYKTSVEKLVHTFHPKSSYKVHYLLLQFYLAMGVRLLRINKVVQFNQQPWLKSFVEKNIDIRRSATTKVESEMAKLASNSVFGKMMQNKRKQMDVVIINNEKQLQRLVSSPLFETVHIISDNLVTVRRTKWRIKLDTPIYTGASVLDLSKLLMYRYVYDFLKPNFGEKARILYTGE